MQILVTVATIQMRALKTEVEQGSVGTVVGHGLVGPKRWGSPVSRFLGFLSFGSFTPVHRKGTRLRFLDRHTPIYFILFSGNASKLGDAAECPGKSFLFFLTSTFFLIVHGFYAVHDWRLCVDTIFVWHGAAFWPRNQLGWRLGWKLGRAPRYFFCLWCPARIRRSLKIRGRDWGILMGVPLVVGGRTDNRSRSPR